MEERSESMVKVIRKKMVSSAAGGSKSGGRAGKVKATAKVKVTKAQPKLIPLPFLGDETPASEAERGQHIEEVSK